MHNSVARVDLSNILQHQLHQVRMGCPCLELHCKGCSANLLTLLQKVCPTLVRQMQRTTTKLAALQQVKKGIVQGQVSAH